MKKLYKYVTQNSVSPILSGRSIKITNPVDFNDPFDCNVPNFLIGNSHKKEIKKTFLKKPSLDKHEKSMMSKELDNDFQNLIKELVPISNDLSNHWNDLITEFRILSVTEKKDNILMWSHYAENHTGAVFGFNCAEGGFLGKARKVSYEDGRNKMNEFTKKLFSVLAQHADKLENDIVGEIFSEKLASITLNLFANYFYIKKNDWQYENEHRLILRRNSELINKSEGLDLISFNAAELSEVIFGVKAESKIITDCRKIIDEKYPNTKVYKAEKRGWDFVLTEI